MGATGRHAPARRLAVTAVVAAALTITAGIAAVAAAQPATPRSAALSVPRANAAVALGPRHELAKGSPGSARGTAESAKGSAKGTAPARLALTAVDRKDCPAPATACVDLTKHMTWLQAGGKVSFGPVRMEPGQPGTVHATPRGTFYVAWKAGPGYMSTIYHQPMPWATFFAPGGIAFHGGSLTHWSHGCVHLTVANARYYQENLSVGAEVVVF
jgi:hypothetical protein